MATIANTLDTAFTPSVGTFIVQCTRGEALLQRRGTSGADWVICQYLKDGDGPVVDNPCGTAQYRFVKTSGTPVVQADQ